MCVGLREATRVQGFWFLAEFSRGALGNGARRAKKMPQPPRCAGALSYYRTG